MSAADRSLASRSRRKWPRGLRLLHLAASEKELPRAIPLLNHLGQDRIPLQSNAGDVMQAVFIASLFVSVTLTTFLLAVSLTNLVGPMLGLTIH